MEVWELSVFSWMANVMRKTQFLWEGDQRKRGGPEERKEKQEKKKKKAGSAKETRHVQILRRKDRYNGAESYLEIRQDGEGQGTVGSANLRGLPGLHRQHFQGSGGGGCQIAVG